MKPSFEIKHNLLTLPKERETDVYHKELNLISWYGKEGKTGYTGMV